jgi:hypothetical protein
VWALERDEMPDVPSRATVWRILTRHGAIVPQPQKRPKSQSQAHVRHWDACLYDQAWPP